MSDVGEDAIRAGRSDEDITIQNSTVTIAGTNSEGNFFQFGIRCGNLTVANSTLDVKAGGSAVVAADELEVSGVNTIVMAETGASEEQDYYALELGRLIMSHGLDLVEGKMNESKKAKIAQPEQAPTDFKVYWVVHPGDEPVNGGMQFPGAITGSEEEARLFEGWFLEDGTRLEDSPYYMGPGANHVGNLDRDVTFYGHWRTAESGEGSPDGGDGFGTLLAVGAVVGVAGVVAYQVGTELILDQLLPAGVAVPHTRAELAMLLWNTAGRPAPATLPAFADVADPELAQAAQWAIEQGYLKARADGSFKPDKGVAKLARHPRLPGSDRTMTVQVKIAPQHKAPQTLKKVCGAAVCLCVACRESLRRRTANLFRALHHMCCDTPSAPMFSRPGWM